MIDSLIERLKTSGDVLCWTVEQQPHWAVHAAERRAVEARWMKREGCVRCRWQRLGTPVAWESLHDLKWLQGALRGVEPSWRRRGTIRVVDEA